MSYLERPPSLAHMEVSQAAAFMNIEAELHRRFLDHRGWWNSFFWISLGALSLHCLRNPWRPRTPHDLLSKEEIASLATEVFEISSNVAIEALRLEAKAKSKSTKETKPPPE